MYRWKRTSLCVNENHILYTVVFHLFCHTLCRWKWTSFCAIENHIILLHCRLSPVSSMTCYWFTKLNLIVGALQERSWETSSGIFLKWQKWFLNARDFKCVPLMWNTAWSLIWCEMVSFNMGLFKEFLKQSKHLNALPQFWRAWQNTVHALQNLYIHLNFDVSKQFETAPLRQVHWAHWLMKWY